MKKDAYYFSHDSNARNDPKILRLRVKHGMRGYGLFWAIIEMLRDQSDYCLSFDFESIAFSLNESPEIVESVVSDFGLFKFYGDSFFSESLNERMSIKEEKSNKARDAANKRWNKESNADAMQTHSERNANPMQLKESKGKEISINEENVDAFNKIRISDDETEITNEIFVELSQSSIWINTVCNNHSAEREDVIQHLRRFYWHCLSNDYFKGNPSNAKRHFNNWIIKGNPILKSKANSYANNPE